MNPSRRHCRHPGPRPRVVGGWLCLTLLAACPAALAADDPAEHAPGRVELRLPDGRVVAGTIVVEAVDGSLLLEHDDGR